MLASVVLLHHYYHHINLRDNYPPTLFELEDANITVITTKYLVYILSLLKRKNG